MCGAVVTSCTLKYLLYRSNKKRDNMTPEEYRIACEGEDLGEKVTQVQDITFFDLILEERSLVLADFNGFFFFYFFALTVPNQLFFFFFKASWISLY